MNRPVKITSPPQLALQSYLDSLLMETTEALPLEIEALPEAPVANAPVDVAELAELIASGGGKAHGRQQAGPSINIEANGGTQSRRTEHSPPARFFEGAGYE